MDQCDESQKRWWVLKEPDFSSRVPVVGRLIVWFRRLWLSVATKWYVRALVQQQSQVNHRLLSLIQKQSERIEVLEEQLVTLDRETVEARRDLVAQLYRMREQIVDLSERLTRLEQTLSRCGEDDR